MKYNIDYHKLPSRSVIIPTLGMSVEAIEERWAVLNHKPTPSPSCHGKAPRQPAPNKKGAQKIKRGAA